MLRPTLASGADDEEERRVRLLLLGKAADLAHRYERPLAAEMDEDRQSARRRARVSGLMEALLTTAVGVGFIAGGTIAALAGARATYLIAGLGSLAVIAWTLARLRAHAGAGSTRALPAVAAA
jgi:hypothetical protein